jgi:hypothetical protein
LLIFLKQAKDLSFGSLTAEMLHSSPAQQLKTLSHVNFILLEMKQLLLQNEMSHQQNGGASQQVVPLVVRGR